MRKSILIGLLWTAGSGSLGQAPAPAPDLSRDEALQQEIEERFGKSKISKNNFKVTVRAGVAILEGRTDIPQHKGTATRLARLAGAEVDNRIQVGDPKDEEKEKPRDARPRRVQVRWPEKEQRRKR